MTSDELLKRLDVSHLETFEQDDVEHVCMDSILENYHWAAARIRELEAQMKWMPIETAPSRPQQFLAENANGDWLKVMRSDMPEDFTGPGAVSHAWSGRWWQAKRWMPLPEPPQEKADE